MLPAYNNLKLSNKILLPTILTIGLIMALFAIYLLEELSQTDKARLDSKASRITSLLSLSVAESVWNYDVTSIQVIAKAFFSDHDVIEVVVLDGSEEVLIHLSEGEKNDIHRIERAKSITDRGTLIGKVKVVLTSHYIDFEIAQVRKKLVFLMLLIFAVLALLISFISKFTLRPLANILSGINQLSKGNYQYQVKINAMDELGQVADQFNNMSSKITTLQQTAVTTAEVNKEMQIATDIQMALQPPPSALIQDNYEIAAIMKPAEEVGGDYYDCLRDISGRLWFGIGDVTGHGLVSGLVMMMTQVATNTLLRNIPQMTPVELLTSINKVIHANIKNGLKSNHHMTISFLVEIEDGIFNYAGAHESILIYRAKTRDIELIDTKGMWLGIIPDIEKQTSKGAGQFLMYKNDICLIYTDGVIEIMNQEREQYDVSRLSDFMKRYAQNKTINELVELLYRELMAFKKQQIDDISYLFFKKK